VRYVLEGSVRKAGNNLRITAQLIDSQTDTHLWAEKYNGTLDDVFDIQEKVSRAIAGSLKLKLSTAEEELISIRPIENVQAYEYFLQARREIYRFTEEGFDRSLVLLRNGIEIAGENELFYTTMGTAYFMYFYSGIKPEFPYIRKIEECASVLLRLNPDSSGGHYLLGAICAIRAEMQKAAKEFAKCLLNDNSNIDCMLQLSRIYCAAGKMEEADALLEKVLALDPLNLAIVYSMPGYIKLLTGKFDEAVELYRKMYEMDPVSPVYRLFYSWSLIYAGRKDEAIKIIEQLAADNPGSSFTAQGLVYKYALSGDIENLKKHVTPELESLVGAAEYTSREMSNAYAVAGEKEKALEWLEKAVNCGFINYPFISKYNPFMKPLYNEPGFRKLMGRVKNAWETFEV
jgi:eukaryotic-like serine/threonine-protein kinase